MNAVLVDGVFHCVCPLPYAIPDDLAPEVERWLRAAWSCRAGMRSDWKFALGVARHAHRMVIVGTRDVIRDVNLLRYPLAWRVTARRFRPAGLLEALDDVGDIWRLTLPESVLLDA